MQMGLEHFYTAELIYGNERTTKTSSSINLWFLLHFMTQTPLHFHGDSEWLIYVGEMPRNPS